MLREGCAKTTHHNDASEISARGPRGKEGTRHPIRSSMASLATRDGLRVLRPATSATVSEPEPESASQAVPKTINQASPGATKTPRAMKKCTVPGCASYARSRARCKAHGGGKRCKAPECELSDQGGGFCIRHGGGKRCEVDGCDKSAQSRRFCKAHGGGVRCKVDGCVKTSQGAGCCRAHGGGSRSKTQMNKKSNNKKPSPSRVTGNDEPVAPCTPGASRLACVASSHSENENGNSLAFRIQSVSAADNTDSAAEVRERGATKRAQCRIEGCGNAVPAGNASRLCDDHGTNLHFAASLLGMLSAEAT